MIYKLSDDYENTSALFLDGAELYTKMPKYKPRFFATPRGAEWAIPTGSFYISENSRVKAHVVPDITNWGTGVLAFGPKAYEEFYNDLAGFGEFLPIAVGDATYYLFNTLYVVPDEAIDLSSAVEVVDSGVHLGKSNYRFDEDYLTNNNVMVFKSSVNMLFQCFGTQQFKNKYESLGFKGLVFDPAW